MTTYADFPDCLPRYSWLIEDAGRDVARMFHGAHGDCKVCGETVGVGSREQSAHRRLHVSQLERAAVLRKRAALARTRETNRLRAETRRLAA